jgi:hypothetical protein
MSELAQNEASFSLVGRKIMLGLPTYDHKVSAKMAIALMDFAVKAQKHGVAIQISNISGCSVVSRVRNIIAKDFLDSDCTDLMFIDSDINFNADDIFRLMAWNTDPKKGIVAGIPVARKKQKTFITHLETDGEGNVFMDKMGLVQATKVATAFMLIRKEVFPAIKAMIPDLEYADERGGVLDSYFDFSSRKDGYMGEDFLFCERARQAGFEIWIDPTIKLGHMGIEEFEGSFGEDWLYPQLRSVDTNKDAA